MKGSSTQGRYSSSTDHGLGQPDLHECTRVSNEEFWQTVRRPFPHLVAHSDTGLSSSWGPFIVNIDQFLSPWHLDPNFGWPPKSS